jgi:phenylacetate-CoA ligase
VAPAGWSGRSGPFGAGLGIRGVSPWLLGQLLRARTELASHDAWTRERMLNVQSRRLDELRSYAVVHSPFYAELHRGFADAPLEALPTVSKATVMARFDDVVTDRDVRLADVERYLATASATDTFRGRYRVAATGGTTGRRGIFLADRVEWATILASYARAYAWAGVSAGLRNRIRMAVVSSRNPSHQSSIVGATVASRWIPTLRLDATDPIPSLVGELNAFRPDALVGYASILRILAEEQAAGRLGIAPRAVMSASEVLTDDTRVLITAAFGVRATNVYGATETAGIASECQAGHLHRYEDLVIAEIVDRDNRPVPADQPGDKLLVTVLFARTQPLIRYELSDRVTASREPLQADLPFATLARIEGREEEVLELGGIRVHPNVFHHALDGVTVAGWQVVDEDGRLRVLLVLPEGELPDVAARIRVGLDRLGVRGVPVAVETVAEIPKTPLGKTPFVIRRTYDPAAVVPELPAEPEPA